MRDSWNSYITAPVLLSASVLAEALVDLNAEVSTFEQPRWFLPLAIPI